MTAISLRAVVADALAEVGVTYDFCKEAKGGGRKEIWLGTERGFGIRSYASGRSVYVVQARMAGRSRTITIGPTSVLTETQAQMVARRVLAHAEVGHDPATDRQRVRAAPSFSDFLDEYWARWSPHWKASTVATHTAYRRKYLNHAFKDRTIDELNEEHVTRWFADLNNHAGPGAANRTLEIVKHMFTKAEHWGYRLENTNPCRAVRANRRKKRERFLSVEELARLGGELAALRASEDRTEQSVGAALTLLLLTGCRYREILNLQWQDVNGRRLLLRDSKTGPRTVWLGEEARAVIRTLPRVLEQPWLFWNFTYVRPMRCLRRAWGTAIRRAGLGKLRIHDLRHTFASHAAMSRETLPMIGRLLGHANHRSTARYAHLDDLHLLAAAQQIGDGVAANMSVVCLIEPTSPELNAPPNFKPG